MTLKSDLCKLNKGLNSHYKLLQKYKTWTVAQKSFYKAYVPGGIFSSTFVLDAAVQLFGGSAAAAASGRGWSALEGVVLFEDVLLVLRVDFASPEAAL